MADGFYEAVCRELQKFGFRYWKPAKGSHEKWRSDDTGRVVLVPRNMKSRHTANAILKDAGSSRKL